MSRDGVDLDALRAELESIATRSQADGDVVHAQIAVSLADGEVEVEAPAEGEALREDTIWWVASMTKPIVAALAAQAASEGLLDLDDPIAKYVPEFDTIPSYYSDGQAVPFDRRLTVRDFVTMTSGLQSIGVPNDTVQMPAADDDLASYVAKLGTAVLEFAPGTQWHYSNAVGFEVVARVVEVATGTPFATRAREVIFGPLGMDSTSFGVNPDLEDRTLPIPPMLAGNPITGTKFSSGSAGLFTTAADYLRFARMLRDGGVYEGAQVLPREVVEELSRNQIGDIRLRGVAAADYGHGEGPGDPTIGYGYGVLVLLADNGGGTTLPEGSFGWDGIGSRRFWAIPSLGAAIVILADGPGAAALHRSVESAVAAAVTA